MCTVEGWSFFFNMPSSCTFVMFNLGVNSMKNLIWSRSLLTILNGHWFGQIPFFAIRTLSTQRSISGNKNPVLDLPLKSSGKMDLETNEPQSGRVRLGLENTVKIPGYGGSPKFSKLGVPALMPPSSRPPPAFPCPPFTDYTCAQNYSCLGFLFHDLNSFLQFSFTFLGCFLKWTLNCNSGITCLGDALLYYKMQMMNVQLL